MDTKRLFKFVTMGAAKKALDQQTTFIPIKYEAPEEASGNDQPVSRLITASPAERDALFNDVVEKNYIRSWEDVGLRKNDIKEWSADAAKAMRDDPGKRPQLMKHFRGQLEPIKKSWPQIWESLYTATNLRREHTKDIPRQVELIKFLRVAERLLAMDKGLEDFETEYSKHVVVLASLADAAVDPAPGTANPDPSNEPNKPDLGPVFEERKDIDEIDGKLRAIKQEAMRNPQTRAPVLAYPSNAVATVLKGSGHSELANIDTNGEIVAVETVERALETVKQRNFSNGFKQIKDYNRRAATPLSLSDYVREMSAAAITDPAESVQRISSKLDPQPLDPQKPKPNPSLPHPTTQPVTHTLQSLGTGILYVVEEELNHYELTEISHIENVMKGEEKNRTFTSSTETEQYEESETIETSEVERDNQVNESYALSSEVAKTVDTAFNTAASLSVSGKYGVVNIAANGSFSYSANNSLTETSAQSFSKDVVDRSVERVSTQTRELRSYRVTTRVEDENKHGFNNVEGDGHIRGIYRWLDKVSTIKLYDYGEREFYQFSVPEPASLYQYLEEKHHEVKDVYLPEYPDFTADDVTLSGYLDLCSEYRVEEIPAPPTKYIKRAVAIMLPASGEGESDKNNTRHVFRTAVNHELVAPEGYDTTQATADVTTVGAGKLGNDEWREFYVVLGDESQSRREIDGDLEFYQLDYGDILNFSQSIPITVSTYGLDAITVNVAVTFKRSSELLDAWRRDVHQAILQSYDRLKLTYDQAEAAAQSEGDAYRLRDLTPDEKDKIVLGELKRGCIDLLTRGDYQNFTALSQTGDDAPTMQYNEAIEHGEYIAYFENCFEWEQMIYSLFPYYWARDSQWQDKAMETDSDPHFSNFLSAGAAQIIVPVRPGYEKSIRTYIDSGSVLQSLDLPILDLEDYYALEESYQRPDDDRIFVDEWEVKYPTDLVYVQDAEEAASLIQEAEAEA